MSNSNQFYTLKGYQLLSTKELTPAMEDYLEMIYRILLTQPYVRINELSAHLSVKPSSCTKYIQQLYDKGLLYYKKYGYITLTDDGNKLALSLYQRHDILSDFFCTINHSQNELELVEKVEHFIDSTTLNNLKDLTEYLKQHKY